MRRTKLNTKTNGNDSGLKTTANKINMADKTGLGKCKRKKFKSNSGTRLMKGN